MTLCLAVYYGMSLVPFQGGASEVGGRLPLDPLTTKECVCTCVCVCFGTDILCADAEGPRKQLRAGDMCIGYLCHE